MSAADALELIDWRSLDADDRAAVLDLRIPQRQIEFAGTVARSVAACEAGDPATSVGLAIRADATIVGWLALRRGDAAPGWAGGAVVVGGLRIAQSQQGRGLGSRALSALPDWICRHWPDATRLLLRVDDDNAAGIRAYEKAGWTEVGERCAGRVGIERTMALALPSPA